MNSDPQNPNPKAPVSAHPSGTPTPFAYRGNGKVARLPRNLREQINNWMLDGVSYPQIIKRLGDTGRSLTPDNLSEWKKRGHQAWLLEQAWLAHLHPPHDSAALPADVDAAQINHAALQLGTLHIFETFRALNSPPPPDEALPANGESPALGRTSANRTRTMLDFRLGGDCTAFVRLIHALARASRASQTVTRNKCDPQNPQ